MLIQETVWLEDIPVATLRPNGSGGVDVFYIHSDHLNTPRIITRPSDNAERWRWDSDPFGTTAANENPAGLGTFVYNLRFPGQVYDSVAGMHYNYFRDYDAATGSYAESDPLGLDAGMMSTYAYAAQAPNLYDDPDGQILPAMAWPAAMAYARCFGQCTALDTLAEVVAYGQECVNGAGILKNCAVECLNPLNYVGAGKILKAARGVADANRAASRAKGIPDSQIGPSGKHKIHVKEHATRKRAEDAAQDRSRRGTAPEEHSNPTVGDPHFHPSGSNSREHHTYPGKGFPRNEEH